MAEEEKFELAFPPEFWDLELRDGDELVVMTHGYHVDGDEVVFSLQCVGTPDFEVESLRIPLALFPEGFA